MKVHPDFLDAADRLYGPLGLECSELQVEPESAEYGACRFDLGGRSVVFRASKITPTKIGQFVTCWKRVGSSPIQPFDISDPFDFLVVSCRSEEHFGQFVFPKPVLREKDVVSEHGKGGKRGIRVYPPWDEPESRQAQRTQDWQSDYFLKIEDAALDKVRARKLYGLEP
ncbi:MepB family protein [Microvirga sp. ACRRW]|uniref:MepB family protein n=1 Tax=Microvirga sp. ACRRW TaxID=2918205 RepID=UPI001EF5C0DB|nr:MepB family protein [Microvirga sp. ACRRW]MCG7391458.1 MepB family protein [Microvirga sp. ACRRW]